MNTTPSHRLRSTSACGPRSRRRGLALVWLAISMVALIGIVALGIDMGRIQLARTELQTSADATARAAVWPVPQLQFDEGIARAQAVVDANDAGGGQIGYDSGDDDLQYGIWWRNTQTFEPLPPEFWNRANAARIVTHRSTDRGNPMGMGFATVVGFDEANIRTQAIAQIRGGRTGTESGGLGIYGIDWVQTNGTTMTDSYDPTVGPYDPNTAGDGGGVGSNGYIEFIGTTFINGGARSGPDGDTSPDTDYLEVWPNADVTGWQAPLDEEMVFPPVTMPAVYNNQPLIDAGLLETKGKWKGGIVRTGTTSVTIPGGTAENPNIYVVTTLQLNSNASIFIDGAVEFYVTGPVDLTGSITVNAPEGSSWPLPSDLKIFVIGDHDVQIGGGSALHAQIYAPESDVTIHGTSGEFGLFGGVVGRTVDVLGNSGIHVDMSLKWPGQEPEPFYVELVH